MQPGNVSQKQHQEVASEEDKKQDNAEEETPMVSQNQNEGA